MWLILLVLSQGLRISWVLLSHPPHQDNMMILAMWGFNLFKTVLSILWSIIIKKDSSQRFLIMHTWISIFLCCYIHVHAKTWLYYLLWTCFVFLRDIFPSFDWKLPLDITGIMDGYWMGIMDGQVDWWMDDRSN